MADGWTDLSVTGDGIVYYVSTSGSDGNDGLSPSSPIATLSHGYSLLRNGHPDQLLLKAGDQWNTAFPAWAKSAQSASAYMVIGTYDSSPSLPRALIRCSGTGFDGGGGGHNGEGLALFGIDFESPDQSTGDAGILFFAPWSNILIENCRIDNFPVNIVIQEVSASRSNNIQIRRNIITDAYRGDSGHSQGIFLGSCDNWLIEENVLDRNARNKADLFCHNVYIHETNGSGIFRRNISARACSHGVQQRPGGRMENNLYLRNSVNAYIDQSASGTTAAENYVGYNVALGAKDINNTDRRGQGFHLGSGATSLLVEYNVAAHQDDGTDAVEAFELHALQAHIHHNVAYNWESPNNEGWATAFQWESGGGLNSGQVLFENNLAIQLLHGMAVRHEGRAFSGEFTYRNNQYYTQNPFGGYAQFSWSAGSGGSFAQWVSTTGESGSTFTLSPWTSIDARISAYMSSLSLTATLDAFLTEARLLSEQNWDSRFLASTVNDWVRDLFNLPQIGDGSGNHTITIAQTSETDSTQHIDAVGGTALVVFKSQVDEVDETLPITVKRTKTILLTQVSETDSALPPSIIAHTIPISQLSEIDSVITSITLSHAVTVALLQETDSPLSITPFQDFFPPTDTPSSRTLVISAESRTYLVPS